MNTVNLMNVKFTSYLKLMIYIAGSTGLFFGLLLFVLSLLGAPVTAELGTAVYTGVIAGIISIFISPLLFLFLGLLWGIISFLPFKLALKVFKGMTIEMK
ncbi:hypothetical protein ACTWQB_13475 [Piscibacillus sp. B03]|uniref:hypothetical protein n=1 Tax=Piscibacillus sp. B03 TaxID=3457430 RepID=UPI003FCE28D3